MEDEKLDYVSTAGIAYWALQLHETKNKGWTTYYIKPGGIFVLFLKNQMI